MVFALALVLQLVGVSWRELECGQRVDVDQLPGAAPVDQPSAGKDPTPFMGLVHRAPSASVGSGSDLFDVDR